MRTLRVVIVDDSALARGLLRGFLEEHPDIQVVGEAENGLQAVERVQALRPDLVTMDLEMPVMGGLQAIEEIMHHQPTPILVVSGAANAANAVEAIGRGALEVVAKPDFSPEQGAEFVVKVRLLAGVAVFRRKRSRAPIQAPAGPLAPAHPHGLPPAPRVLAIASSTGGPQALAHILARLPGELTCPILIAQHISDGFAQGMVEWLQTLCPLPIHLAAEGEAILPGHVYVSPSEAHLAVTPTRRLTLVGRGPGDLYHPCCDILLGSAAAVFGARTVGLILTGMGHDGAVGLGAIRAAGGITLAQDEASSVIFGMNRVAIERGVVQRVLPLEGIPDALANLAAQGAPA